MITEYALCALPDWHADWRHLAIRVRRRGPGDRWLLTHGAYYLTGDGDWSPAIEDAVEYGETDALRIAEQQTVLVEVNGLTAADLLNR